MPSESKAIPSSPRGYLMPLPPAQSLVPPAIPTPFSEPSQTNRESKPHLLLVRAFCSFHFMQRKRLNKPLGFRYLAKRACRGKRLQGVYSPLGTNINRKPSRVNTFLYLFKPKKEAYAPLPRLRVSICTAPIVYMPQPEMPTSE